MPDKEWIYAGTLQELHDKRAKVVKGGIAVFSHEDGISAVDNRCPHLGFPLHLGSVCDGILTCHWHHARFDVCSGGTLDPWADDVPAHEVRIDGDEVWVQARSRLAEDRTRLQRRLREGLEQNIGIVIAKAVVGLVESGVPADEIFQIGVSFGVTQGPGWGSGLTILTAMRNVLPKLDKADRILALYHGLLHVARASAGRAPRHLLGALPNEGGNTGRLRTWYRNCVEVRDTQGAEKVLLTAIEEGLPAARLADLMLVSVTDHFYLDGGHVFDFHNKAFEALEGVEGLDAAAVLASLLPMMGDPARSEELHHWQAPVDLVTPLRQAFARIEAAALGAGEEAEAEASPRMSEGRELPDVAAFFELLLGDRPLDTVDSLTELLLQGVAPAKLARLIAAAAAERIVRFHTQNDFGDWIAVLHTFTYAHAVHERLRRSDEPLLVRALYHGAVAIYHDRFLNVPKAPRTEGKPGADGGAEGGNRLSRLLELMDRRQQVDEAARFVADYRADGADLDALWRTLGHSLLREDAEFHSFQMYEAAATEFERWCERSDAFAERMRLTLLLACTRYLAAHAPTARETPHTARIAWRLQRGERLYEDGSKSDAAASGLVP